MEYMDNMQYWQFLPPPTEISSFCNSPIIIRILVQFLKVCFDVPMSWVMKTYVHSQKNLVAMHGEQYKARVTSYTEKAFWNSLDSYDLK